MSYEVNVQFFNVTSELEGYRLACSISGSLAGALPSEQWIEQHAPSLLPYELEAEVKRVPKYEELFQLLVDNWVKKIFQIKFLYWPQYRLLGAVSDSFPGSMPNHILTASVSVLFQDSTDQAYPYSYWGRKIPLFGRKRAEVLMLPEAEAIRETGYDDPDYARRSLLYQRIFSSLDMASWLDEKPGNYVEFSMCSATRPYQCSRLSSIAKVHLLRLVRQESKMKGEQS